MLEMRPTCEHCNAALAADTAGAYSCSYECTFCERCTDELLDYVCPNCTGALLPRPPRPSDQLALAPPTETVTFQPVDLDAHPAKVAARAAAAGRPTHLCEVVVDCADPARLATFYGDLLGVKPVLREADWAYLMPPLRGAQLRAGGAPPVGGMRIAFQRVPEPRASKVRLHLDLGAWGLAAQVERAVALGGFRLSEPIADEHGGFVVMADPEGHEFCLVDP